MKRERRSWEASIWTSGQLAKLNKAGVEFWLPSYLKTVTRRDAPRVKFGMAKAIWMSKRIAKMGREEFDKEFKIDEEKTIASRLWREGITEAGPWIFFVAQAPAELSDWRKTKVDLHLEKIVEPLLRAKTQMAFIDQSAVAFLKGSQWFGLRHSGCRFPWRPGALEAVKITPEQAQKMVRLPDDWERHIGS